jgi:hypothetical protein
MAKPNFTLPNKPAIKSGSILSYNYTDDFTFVPAPLTFNRDSAATRVNEKGLIEDVGYFGPELVQNGDFSEIGPELITNGDFATDSDWAKGTGWSISGGKANCDGTQTGNTNLNNSSSNGIVNNKFYKIVYTISNYVSGSIRIKAGNTGFGVYHSSNGTYTQYIKAQVSTFPYAQFNADADFIGSIDNISVKEVGQNWTFGTDWSVGNNKLIGVNATTETSQVIFPTTGIRNLKISFDVVVDSGSVAVYMDGETKVWITSSGSVTRYVTSETRTLEIDGRNSDAFNGYITNISVIEVLGDKPRIDYSDSLTEPSLLLEPQSTNLILYSQELNNSDWSTTRLDVLANQIISPDGTLNADLLTPTASAFNHSIGKVSPVNYNSQESTVSFFAKFNGYNISASVTTSPTNWTGCIFDLENGIAKTPQNAGAQSLCTSKIENYGNGWYRCSITFTPYSSGTFYNFWATVDSTDANLGNFGQQPYTADGISGVYLWGCQSEEGSYATSYIPTAGSTATRLGETANNAGDVNVFNSEEGVLYAEIAALANDGTNRQISISNGTTTERVYFGFRANTNEFILSSKDSSYVIATVNNVTDYNKYAFQYKLGNFKAFVNGVSYSLTANGGSLPTSLDRLSFDNASGTQNFYGKVRNLKVFNKALTDRELEILTIQ